LVFVDNVYRIGEFADRVGRSASTVRRWEREKRITAKRTATGQRYFTDADVRAALRMPGTDPADREVVVCCRVSSKPEPVTPTSRCTRPTPGCGRSCRNGPIATGPDCRSRTPAQLSGAESELSRPAQRWARS